MTIWDSEHILYAKRSSWTTVINNSIEYEYYSGVATGNPSGNKNIKRLVHKDGYGNIVFVQNFEWDSDDDVIREYCTKE